MRFEMSLKRSYRNHNLLHNAQAVAAVPLLKELHLAGGAGNGEAGSRHHPWRSPVAGAGGAQ